VIYCALYSHNRKANNFSYNIGGGLKGFSQVEYALHMQKRLYSPAFVLFRYCSSHFKLLYLESYM
jgi:hypothetical protein